MHNMESRKIVHLLKKGGDVYAMAQDAAPFLFSAKDAQRVRLFTDYLEQVCF